MTSGSEDSGNGFGNTYVIKPTGVHKATIVWLHDIGCTGSDSQKALKGYDIPNIKWICPTAPTRPVTSFGELKTTAWCDVSSVIVFEGMQEDLESLEYVNTYVSLLLSFEPSNVMKGVGGVGLGAAQALFYTTSYAYGWVPINISIAIAINGWIPDLKSFQDNKNAKDGIAGRADISRILITHGTSVKDTVPPAFVNKCVDSLRLTGFRTLFQPCGGDNGMMHIRGWLVQNFGIGG